MAKSNKRSKRSVIGAILAGGESVRMGRPKEALRLPNGRTFAKAVEMVLQSCCAEIVSLSPAPILDGVENIPDKAIDSGPLAGIKALLLSRTAARYLVCACDQPLITKEILDLLLADTSNSPAVVLHLEDSDCAEHFPLLLRPHALETVTNLLRDGRRSVSGLLRQIDPMSIKAPHSWRECLRNINTPADLAHLAGND